MMRFVALLLFTLGCAHAQDLAEQEQGRSGTPRAAARRNEAQAQDGVFAAQSNQVLTLWVWHGRHDLRGLDAASRGSAAIAYLSRTIEVHADRLVITPRRDAIYLDEETPRTAVVHIELQHGVVPADFARIRTELLEAIQPVYAERAGAIQIDFDAPRSFRAEYALLLGAIADAKPAAWRLSMTAIASWCLQDRWLRDVPVDQVVPMLFGPGHEKEQGFAALANGPLREPRCNEAVGIREGDPRPPRSSALYVFGQGGWTLARARAAMAQLGLNRR